MKSPITYAKIVATPTLSAWSQAYNAGNLAAVIALSVEPVQNAEGQESISTSVSLASLGKELLNTLEAEYFTIETKNLTNIKQAITATCEKVEDNINLSLVVSVIIENILYVFIYGSGKILMKRSGKLGTLLEQKEKGHLTAASGFIQSNDIVILETEQFAQAVSTEQLLPCLEHDKLNEMAEILSPVIHENQGGAAAALAFSYREEEAAVEKENFVEVQIPTKSHHEKVTEKASELEEKETEEEPKQEETPETQEEQAAYTTRDYAPKRSSMHFSHSKKIILTVVVVVLLVLGFSIYFSIQKQKQAQIQALYNATVVPAQKKFDEGQSLIDLNSSLARQDFQDAKNTLDSAASKLPQGSNEEKQATDLMQKIDDALSQSAQINTVNAKQVDNSSSDLLSALIKHTDAQYAAIDDTNVYVGNNNNVIAIPKKGGKEKTVITNSKDWKSIAGLGAYIGNLYVVDSTDGILKYVGGADSGKAAYFSGTSPDLSKVVSMAIDGSVWLLGSDGSITKYTRGKQDDFSVKGLDKPFNNPTRISTTVDMDNLYILDKGNKRIVVIDKTGNYVAQYQTGLLGNAQDIDPVEKNKLIYFLTGGKIYQIDLK